MSGKLPGRLTIAYQVENPPSEENIELCNHHYIIDHKIDYGIDGIDDWTKNPKESSTSKIDPCRIWSRSQRNGGSLSSRLDS